MSNDRRPSFVRVYADEEGETHLLDLEIPGPDRSYEGSKRRYLDVVPMNTVHVSEQLEVRPFMDLHNAPTRQLVFVLRGGFEIATTDGDSRCFLPGDCLFADDLVGKGHTLQHVGDDLSVSVVVPVAADWDWPRIKTP